MKVKVGVFQRRKVPKVQDSKIAASSLKFGLSINITTPDARQSNRTQSPLHGSKFFKKKWEHFPNNQKS